MADEREDRAVEKLLDLILNTMQAATNRDLACDGDVGDEEGKVWAQIEAQAQAVVDARIDHEARGEADLALRKIDAIRNSIVACQSVNWSAHIYPLVEALESAGCQGMDYEDAKAKFAPTWEQSQPTKGGPVARTSPSRHGAANVYGSALARELDVPDPCQWGVLYAEGVEAGFTEEEARQHAAVAPVGIALVVCRWTDTEPWVQPPDPAAEGLVLSREAEALLNEARRIIDGMDSYASLGGCPMHHDRAADEWRSKTDAFLSDTEGGE